MVWLICWLFFFFIDVFSCPVLGRVRGYLYDQSRVFLRSLRYPHFNMLSLDLPIPTLSWYNTNYFPAQLLYVVFIYKMIYWSFVYMLKSVGARTLQFLHLLHFPAKVTKNLLLLIGDTIGLTNLKYCVRK